MRVRLSTNTALPGDLVIEAENPTEAVLLRIWGNEKRPLMMKNHGGNIEENRITMLIGFREEKPSQGDRDEKPSIGVRKDTHINDSLSYWLTDAEKLLKMSKELLDATEELQEATKELSATAADPERGNRDGVAAAKFYDMLISQYVPSLLAGKMAEAYARGLGG